MEQAIILRCLVYGESMENIFRVRIGEEGEVSDLKDAIKEKKHPQFEDIPAKNLTLWRVSVPLDDNVDVALAGLELKDSDEKRIKKLRPSDEISGAFLDLDKKHIHVIIQPPVTG